MRPILLKGHERSITCVIYNKDGDLLFSCSKDHVPCLWMADTGSRIGTYNGHGGAVWTLDISHDSQLLASGSADQTARIWEVETGVEIANLQHTGAVRSVQFDASGRSLATLCDQFGSLDVGRPPLLRVYAYDSKSQEWELRHEHMLAHPEVGEPKCVLLRWMPLNAGLLTAYESGELRVLDVATGEEKARTEPHSKEIRNISFNRERTMFLTTSLDQTAKLIDVADLSVLKTYQSDRPLNAGGISELKEHVIVGGGQDAMKVTTSSSKAGNFEAQLFHTIYEEEFGRVKGHFGPINTLAINPDGRSYASGGEDGYVRLHHFDNSYLEMRDPVPEEVDEPPPPPIVDDDN